MMFKTSLMENWDNGQFPAYAAAESHDVTLVSVHVEVTMLWASWYCAQRMYAGCNYGNVNVSKAAGGYWKEEEDIGEYATLYSPLSDYRDWENSDSSTLCSQISVNTDCQTIRYQLISD